jgi:hypothetical protein
MTIRQVYTAYPGKNQPPEDRFDFCRACWAELVVKGLTTNQDLPAPPVALSASAILHRPSAF